MVPDPVAISVTKFRRCGFAYYRAAARKVKGALSRAEHNKGEERRARGLGLGTPCEQLVSWATVRAL